MPLFRRSRRQDQLARRARSFMAALEPRVLLSTPGDIQPDTFSSFDKGERQALIARMTNLAGRDGYAAKIGSGTTAKLRDFDNSLRKYMQERTNVEYFYDSDEVTGIAAFIKSNLDVSGRLTAANNLVDKRIYVDNTSIAGNINFRDPDGTKGGNAALNINRFEYWSNLADAAYLGNDVAKYTNEVTYELARWSQLFDGNLDAPGDWTATGKSGWQLVSSIRAESWTDAYFKLNTADNGAWGGADNSLMLYKLMQTGDWLYAQSKTTQADTSTDSNKSITLAKSLYYLGRMFPEFDTAAAWEAKGRSLLIDSMRAQVYDDGSHREQSVGYAIGVADDVLDVYHLDRLNNDAGEWNGEAIQTLSNLIEANRQFLDPDGRRPGIGDTLRTFSVSGFLKAGTVLGKINVTQTTLSNSISNSATTFNVANASAIQIGDALTAADKSELMRVTGKNGNTITVTRGIGGTSAQSLSSSQVIYDLDDQPFAKPGIGDVWQLGVGATRPFVDVPAIPEGVLGNRGKAFAMPDSGNYILRSDDTSSATQITFDSGPKGGSHGHMDLLNFELWSGGRPLIVDPGPYLYDNSADRNYVVSTKAHNTVNVDGQNVGWVDGEDTPALASSHSFGGSSATVTGTHSGYAYLAGAPTLSRTIYYDYGDTMVIVDFDESSAKHTFSQSFNVPGTAEANVSGASGGTEFKTRYTSGDNVRVQTINGGTLTKGSKTFVTGPSSSGYKSDAYRYTVAKADTTYAVFVTLVNIYTGLSVPNVSAELLTSNPQPGQAIQVKLTRDGSAQTLNFAAPELTRADASTFNLGALVNDSQYDSKGNLHVAYQDLAEGYLHYTVKDASTGKWSPSITVDDSAHGVGAQIDLALDNVERPGIAYYDSANGDLKYASIITQNNAWRVQTVDSKTTVGQNPSLIFSRKGGSAIISYYSRTKGDLKVAEQQTATSWNVRNFDTGGDVGRYSQIMLDPNRTELNSRYVIAYEDRTNAGYKYAYLSGEWKYDLVKASGMTATGGFMSLAFEDSGSGATSGVGANRYVPRFTFYEWEPDPSLWLAKKDKTTGAWSTARVDGKGSTKKLGAYNQLSYASGKAEVFYFDDRNLLLKRAVNNGGNSWSYTTYGPAGREVRINRYKSKWTVFGFDAAPDILISQTFA